MKIFGGFSGQRDHKKAGSKRRTAENTGSRRRTAEEQAEIDQLVADYQRKKRVRRIVVLSVLAALLLGGFAFYKITVRPPAIVTPTQKPVMPTNTSATGLNANAESTDALASPAPAERKRRDKVYTFLMVGMDQNFGNTDTIMVCVFDANAKSLNILSIPRDTCANVESNESLNETKKINAVYSRAGIDGLMAAVGDIVGCPIDSYVTVGINAFVHLVDTIGGVYFDVPYYMDYDDPTQDLHIHYKAGPQNLNGSDAVKVVRWRQNNDGSNYGDIARIQTQQSFLKTVAKQCLSLSNLSSNLKGYMEIFKEYVKTDMSTGNLVWYGQQFLSMSMDDIHFHTLPANYNDSIKGFAYGTVLVDQWLTLLNESFNVYDQPLTEADINVISRDENGKLYATSGEINGGYESFLDYDAYLVRLKAWNDHLAQQKKDEAAQADSQAAPPSVDAVSQDGNVQTRDDVPAQPQSAPDATENGDTPPDTGGDTEDMNGGE